MLLTLFGLLISLFSIHLGAWLGQLTSLRSKWDLNQGSTSEKKGARREVKYELKGIFTHVPFLLTSVVVLFASGVLYLAICNWNALSNKTPQGFGVLFFGFFAIMILVTLYLLIRGWLIGRSLQNEIKSDE